MVPPMHKERNKNLKRGPQLNKTQKGDEKRRKTKKETQERDGLKGLEPGNTNWAKGSTHGKKREKNSRGEGAKSVL